MYCLISISFQRATDDEYSTYLTLRKLLLVQTKIIQRLKSHEKDYIWMSGPETIISYCALMEYKRIQ